MFMHKNVYDKEVNFKDFSRPYKQIKYFSSTLTEVNDFSRQLLKFKNLSRSYEPFRLVIA